MENIFIGGIQFINFGANNYSCGMELIACDNPPKDLIDKFLAGTNGFERVWLNPCAPCTEYTFYGVMGTYEQYKKFYIAQREAIIAKAMVKRFGVTDWPEPRVTDTYKQLLLKQYKDWWEK